MTADYGRKAYLDLMVSKDPAIGRIVAQGYEFLTNAFTPDGTPAGLHVKDTTTLVSQLEREGYLVELGSAYDQKGDRIPTMRSVWRKR